jgi:hypothetical protein
MVGRGSHVLVVLVELLLAEAVVAVVVEIPQQEVHHLVQLLPARRPLVLSHPHLRQHHPQLGLRQLPVMVPVVLVEHLVQVLPQVLLVLALGLDLGVLVLVPDLDSPFWLALARSHYFFKKI